MDGSSALGGGEVRHYLHVDNNGVAKKVAICHIDELHKHFPTLLSHAAMKRAFFALPSDISLIATQEITQQRLIDLVIVGWSCQGMSIVGLQNGLNDSRTSRFWGLI